MSLSELLKSGWAKPAAHLLCLTPLCLLLWAAVDGGLGANPVEKLTHETGEWTLRLLLVTLALSPLRQWSGAVAWLRFRRLSGLYSFFYCCCHFAIWFVADHSLDPGDMLEDIIKRPYITLGFSAFLLLIPLAATSTRTMQRRLGRNWKRLHQLVYAILVLALLHLLWQVKADYLEAAIYAIIGLILLMHRVDPLKRYSRSFPTIR